MAIKNVLQENSYTTLDVNYSKQDRNIAMKITIKEKKDGDTISQLPLAFSGIQDHVVEDNIEFPKDPKIGDTLFLKTQTDVPFQRHTVPILDKDGKPVEVDGITQTKEEINYTKMVGILTWNGSIWNMNPTQIILSNNQFYKYGKDSYEVYDGKDTKKWWDENFAIDLMKEYDDVYAYCYSWLMKNHPLFKNTEVC